VQVKCIKVRDSKYGTALVVETSEFSGAYILGFRVDNLDEVYMEITNLFKTYSQNPMFGVEVSFEDVETNLSAVTIPRVEDNLEIIDTGYSISLTSNKAAYSMDGGTGTKKDSEQIIFSEEIGLAIEKPPNGMSLDQLWKIV
jgi:Bardet-Biedl syndrome 5 protein